MCVCVCVVCLLCVVDDIVMVDIIVVVCVLSVVVSCALGCLFIAVVRRGLEYAAVGALEVHAK